MSEQTTTELQLREPNSAVTNKSEIGFVGLQPKEMIATATEIANLAGDIITKQKLFVNIGTNKYVKAEGWAIVGSLAGILSRERQVLNDGKGNYCAIVDLINVKTGMVVGSGSSICGMDEPMWAKRPNFARRSMAITRATSKAYKGSYSWIISLAGYSSTPAEEMDHVIYENRRKNAERNKLSDAIPPRAAEETSGND